VITALTLNYGLNRLIARQESNRQVAFPTLRPARKFEVFVLHADAKNREPERSKAKDKPVMQVSARFMYPYFSFNWSEENQ
jgi:hypothetical protein